MKIRGAAGWHRRAKWNIDEIGRQRNQPSFCFEVYLGKVRKD